MTFEDKVRNDGFKNPLPYSRVPEVRAAYDQKESKLYEEFMNELTLYLVNNGVPAQYARKVAYKAYQDGHALGYTEVFNVASNLMEIFEVSR